MRQHFAGPSAVVAPVGPSRALPLLLIVGLAARLVCGLWLPTDDAHLARLPDQVEYLALGRSLLAGTGLRFFDARYGQFVHATRAPLYPMFVATCGGSVRAIRVAQALIDTATILAAWLLARRWLGRSGAAVTAALVALSPFLIYFSALILSETLFTALLAWGMVLVASRWRGARVAGYVVLALAVLDRPSAILLPALLTLCVPRKLPVLAPRLLTMCAAGLLTLGALLPWAIRNRLDPALGQWVFTTTNGGVTLYDGFNPAATGGSDQRFVQSMPELRTMSEIGRDKYFARLAREYVADHPARATRLTVIKIGRIWSPVPLSEYGRRPAFIAGALVYSVALMGLTLIGLLRLLGEHDAGPSPLPRGTRGVGFGRRAALYCILPAIYLTVVHAASVGSLRYRVPADVPMAVVAGSAIARAGHRRQAF